MMSGKGWHSGGLRRVGDDLSQISVHCQGRGAGSQGRRTRDVRSGDQGGRSISAAAFNLGLHPSPLPVLE
jgi:hypothetical protein